MTSTDYRGQNFIVTGASSGLGEEFARRLAERGSDLVLVARRGDRLAALADELTRQHGVRVTTLVRDLGSPEAGRTLREELQNRGISVTGLVNNAGFGSRSVFAREDPARLQSMIALNVSALVDLTHAFVEPLTRNNGTIINVASILGYQPTPYLAVYGATKSFVLSFTESLWEETRTSGLRVLAICPGAVATEFYDVAGSRSADFGTKRATPRRVVDVALGTLDRSSPPPSVISNGRPLSIVTKFMPRRAVVRLMGALQRRAGAV
ncbi:MULTISPECIES: SDR family NAD(P)-dependent oxidoreductase [Gordonia]|uniref:SDR family NAD(P)-dependent oxidoreductase n=1 Tax=Gordonia TaxID=2053 RepID=UPI001EF6C86B|nr:SDR family oxidoreductase [Gordonia sp. McavH-238-E]MCG7631429.1 SDR family oxidoreductase [Gordonia sp. McavH-238-E]